MADYVPLFKPGQAFNLPTSAGVTGGTLLAISGDGTVAVAGAASTAWIGVAAQDAASGAQVGIYADGVQRLTASGAITAGSPVIAGAAGTVVASATPPAGQQVGVALTTAADAASVTVKLSR